MIGWARPLWPMKQAFVFGDGEVINAGQPSAHQPVVIKLPVLVTVRTEPAACLIVPFIGETHGNAGVAQFVEAYWRDLNAIGFNYAAIEVDPWVAEAMERGGLPATAQRLREAIELI